MERARVEKYMRMILAALLVGSAFVLALPRAARATDIPWKEYEANPVYDPATSVWAWHPCVLYDGDQFSGHGVASPHKMWYQDFTAEPYFKIVYSSDGINWGPPAIRPAWRRAPAREG